MTGRVIDERWIQHEQSHLPPMRGKSNKQGPPQFTLRGMLTFSAAISVCFSLAATAPRIESDAGFVLLLLSMILFWIVLWVTYVRLRVRAALVLHGFGPVLVLLYGLLVSVGIPLFGERLPSFLDFLLIVLFHAALGCLLGSAMSLPTCVLTILVLFWRGSRSRAEARRP
jgi:hypothetical protein